MSKSTNRYLALRSYWAFFLRYKWPALLVASLFVISNILLSILPLFIGKLVGSLSSGGIQAPAATRYVVILVVLSSGHDILWRLGEFLYLRFVNPISYWYENLLFRQVIQKPYPYFVDKFTGKISSNISTITQEMKELTESVFYNYISQLVSMLAIAAILASVNWQTGVIFIACIVVMAAVGRLTIRNSIYYEKLATDTNSTKNGRVIDAIANFTNVKSFQKEAAEQSTIVHAQTINLKAASRSFFWSIVFWGVMSLFVRHLIWPVTIVVNFYLFRQGQLDIEQFATLLTTILLFSTTVWDFIWELSQFNLRQARAEEAHAYLFGQQVIKPLPDLQTALPPAPTFKHGLELCSLSFAYPDKLDQAVLKDINLSVKQGEKIGIVGKSGSGKTTLTKLLLGYYPVPEGSILLDGQALGTDELARLISFVPQDTSLFHRSIAENIAYASDDPPAHEDIVRAAKKANAHQFISQITDGYEALVGERGVKLSAGQRQRIAIARAFLDNKPILILDEATSALDSESEILVQDALEALWQDKTVIAIAHRLSTLRHMDRIIVIGDGQIIEEGTHTALLKAGGVYATLWQHQSGGFIEE